VIRVNNEKMIKKGLVCLFFTLLIFNISAQDIWVSPDGNGNSFSRTNPGSLTNNLLKNKIKSLRNSGKHHIRVILKEGVYSLSSPVIVDNEMAGSAADTLSFIGIATNPNTNEGKTTLSGGRKVTSWQPVGDGIYRTQLPAGANFRQLYIDGKMAVRARHPNRENDANYGPYWRVKYLTGDSFVVIDSSEVKLWRNIADVEMSIHQVWVHSWVKMKSAMILGGNALVSISLFPIYDWGNSNLPYCWENSPDFLDAEGEWYFEKSTNVLSYKPRTGEDINRIEVVYPVMDRLLNIEGTASVPVRNVTVQNIEFIYGNWTAPSINGVRSNQAVQPLDKNIQVDALMQVSYADNVHFANCNIFCTGGDGILFATGVKNSVIEACHFDQVCANAIVIDTYHAKQQSELRLCSDNKVAHNLIENFGMNYANGLGLAAFHVDRLTVEHNEVRYSRYSGLQIANGNDILHDNLIRYNNVHHVMWLHGDCGGIYTMSDQPGTKIYENWVHDVKPGPWVANLMASAIAMDDHSGHILVENNVFNSLSAGVFTITQQDVFGPDRNAHDNIIRNNDSQDVAIMANAGPKILPGVTVSRDQKELKLPKATQENVLKVYPNDVPHKPGIVEAEDFDIGGDGVAYHDNTSGNGGDANFRKDESVDIYGTPGNYSVGWNGDGEWLKYTINTPEAGTYHFAFYVGTDQPTSIELVIDGQPAIPVAVPTIGWGIRRMEGPNVSLSAGNHVVIVRFPGGGMSFDKFEFLKQYILF
jgi:hypothetical protein